VIWFDHLPPDGPSTSAHWAGPEFRSELKTWVELEVGRVLAMEQVKLRAWATVWRVETRRGVFYAKQNCPSQAFEAAALARLARWVPDRVVPVTAVDEARGLLLTPDQGPVLRETVSDDVDRWCDVAAAGAHLQREVAAYVDQLAEVGLVAMPPEAAPAYAAARVEQLASLPTGDPRHLPGSVATGLRAQLPAVARWADDVAALGLPLTLQHNDLHENNVFGGEDLRFFDFADAVLADPLGVLLIPLNALSDALQAGARDRRLRRVADAYLEVWTDLVPARELRRALGSGLQLGRLARVESWVRVAAHMDDAELVAWAAALPAWLATLTEPPPWRDRAPVGFPRGGSSVG
jgi:Phosphotransferase enzyme family